MELQELINDVCEELEHLVNYQRKRYLESYLQDLLSYQRNHPDEVGIPNSLQLYCNDHPEALECRIYDD
jgi:hypothetical protein